jgi:hypothetical protein
MMKGIDLQLDGLSTGAVSSASYMSLATIVVSF